MFWSYSSTYSYICSFLGFLFLILGYAWVCYRVFQPQQRTASFKHVTSLFTPFMLPWLLVLVALAQGSVEPGFGSAAGVAQGGLLILLQLIASWLSATVFRLKRSYWVLELFGTLGGLQFSWFCLIQVQSAFSLLLWLEVSTLLNVLMLSLLTLLQLSSNDGGWSWFTTEIRRQSHLGFWVSLVTFLWMSGFATLFLLWGLGWSTSTATNGSLVDMAYFGNRGITWQVWQNSFVVTVGLGLVFKLFLQPFQLALFFFYRRLSLLTLALYLVSYYCLFVPIFFSIALPLFIACCPQWSLLGTAVLAAGITTAPYAATTRCDLQTAIALSTMFNLGLLLLVSFCVTFV